VLLKEVDGGVLEGLQPLVQAGNVGNIVGAQLLSRRLQNPPGLLYLQNDLERLAFG